MRPGNNRRNWPSASLEKALFASGIQSVAGIDEAGRGSWAGPVVAAAIILPLRTREDISQLSGVRDSKLMTPRQRETWAEKLRSLCLTHGIGLASSREIDEIGIVPATRVAMMRACQQLGQTPEHLVIDYMLLPELALPQTTLAHGDAHVTSIAAASILAKVTRDNIMVGLDEEYPGYGFAQHKGYGTKLHRTCLMSKGPCPIHRQSYAPVRDSS